MLVKKKRIMFFKDAEDTHTIVLFLLKVKSEMVQAFLLIKDITFS